MSYSRIKARAKLKANTKAKQPTSTPAAIGACENASAVISDPNTKNAQIEARDAACSAAIASFMACLSTLTVSIEFGVSGFWLVLTTGSVQFLLVSFYLVRLARKVAA